jgi:hypothetical protein
MMETFRKAEWSLDTSLPKKVIQMEKEAIPLIAINRLREAYRGRAKVRAGSYGQT